MLEIGAVWPSHRPRAFPVILVHNKDGKLWFCIDLRKLNAHTIKEHSLPRIEDTLDSLNGVVWFTALDLKSGYWQVKMDKTYKPLMAFTVSLMGFYKYDCMPFGLVNSLAMSQRLMKTCLGDLQFKWCLIYLNDVIVFSKMPKDHLVWLRAIFEKLKEAGLKLKHSKCEFFKKSLTYSWHRISEGGIETDDSKNKVIHEWHIPKTVTEVRSFLGFTTYYCWFIYKYSKVSQPLYRLISGENTYKKNKFITWDNECKEAFRKLKEICIPTPILPYADFSKPFIGSNSISQSGMQLIAS